jgi:uncharacterized damage-inducible protein DinB
MVRTGTLPDSIELRASVIAAWRTNCRVTSYLVEGLPVTLWGEAIPGEPRRTVRMLLAHLHNARAAWIRTLGRPHGVAVPELVDRRRVGRRALVAALNRSGRGIEALLVLGLDAQNLVPPSPAYVWRNLPLDVGHVLTYFVAHEAHHRGQVILVARQLGQRLPAPLTDGLWQWTTREREWRRAR